MIYISQLVDSPKISLSMMVVNKYLLVVTYISQLMDSPEILPLMITQTIVCDKLRFLNLLVVLKYYP